VVDVTVETLPDVSCFLDRDGVLPTLRETAKGRAWLQVSLLVSSFDQVSICKFSNRKNPVITFQ